MKDSVYTQLTEYITGNQNKFYRLAYSYLNNKEAALDAVQNAVCKALENYPSLRNPDYLKTWFYRVLVNECLAYRKKYRRELPLVEEFIKEDFYYQKEFDAGQIPASGSRWRKGSGKIPITCISSPMKAVFRPLTKIQNFILMRIRIR